MGNTKLLPTNHKQTLVIILLSLSHVLVRRLFSMGEKALIVFQQVLFAHFLTYGKNFSIIGGGKWGDVVH